MKHSFPSIIPQAWTLSLEFYFYFMAPFLVRQKTISLLMLFLASIYLRYWLVSLGLTNDPWPYRLFPTEFAFFLMGIFSYRLYTKIRFFQIPKPIFILFLILILGPVLSWNIFIKGLLLPIVHWNIPLAFSLYFAIILIGLPVIFLFTKNNSFDRWIGEFSYPIYILHISVVFFANHILQISSHDVMYGWKVTLLCFIISFLLLYLLIYPIERMRSHRILSHKM